MPDEETAGAPSDGPQEKVRQRSPADGPSLPYARAFVVQFTADTDVGLEYAAGRIEHLQTGRRKRFESADDLLRWMSALLPRDPDSTAAPRGKRPSD